MCAPSNLFVCQTTRYFDLLMFFFSFVYGVSDYFDFSVHFSDSTLLQFYIFRLDDYTMSVSVSMNRNSRSRMLKVVLLGDGKVGKSSLMTRYVSNKFDSQSFHTIGVEFLNKEVMVDDQSYTIQVGINVLL